MAWDFLQLNNPAKVAEARGTSWGSALGQDFNPRNPNYQGYRTAPGNVAAANRVGLGSYINQGINSLRGVFQPGSNVGGATTLMRKIALSPVGRVAGATMSLPALGAYGLYKTPAMIDALTKRDPNATQSSLFGIDLTQNANEQAALPDVGANAYSEMGPIPDDGSVTNIQYPGDNPIYPRQVYQDRIMNENLMNMERGNINNKGFKFPSILGAVKGGLEFLGDKFGMTQVSPEDRAANEQFMIEQGIGTDPQTGRMYGGDFAGKNKPGASMFGSANFGEMAQKWDEEYGDMDYRTPKMIAKQKRIKAQAAAYAQKLAADKKAAHDAQMAKSGITVTGGGYQGGGDRGRGGQGAFKEDVTSMRSAARSYTDAQGNTGYSRGRKDGGRIGYREGLLVDEDVNIEGPGFDINENVMMASDPTINAELYGLYLDALDSNKIPADTTFEMFKDLMTQAQSQDQGIASMV